MNDLGGRCDIRDPRQLPLSWRGLLGVSGFEGVINEVEHVFLGESVSQSSLAPVADGLDLFVYDVFNVLAKNRFFLVRLSSPVTYTILLICPPYLRPLPPAQRCDKEKTPPAYTSIRKSEYSPENSSHSISMFPREDD